MMNDLEFVGQDTRMGKIYVKSGDPEVYKVVLWVLDGRLSSKYTRPIKESLL